jgi:dienelactone hydrolase
MRRPPVLALALALGVAPAACDGRETQRPEVGGDSAAGADPGGDPGRDSGADRGADRGWAAAAQAPFLARRNAHTTVLRARGPSPGKYVEVIPPPGVLEIRYPSGELELPAWYATPPGQGQVPALVYFHGDFAFGADDFEAVRPFLDAGFAVLTPTLRGENGNPGDFELLWGEVDDARAAIGWLATQPRIDRSRIYAFGHSIGGGIVALTSLYPELPLRTTGSCGGIYMPETFQRWANSERNRELVRFDPSDPEEIELRVLGPNLAWMVHRHVAYVGRDDPWFVTNAKALADAAWALGKPFEQVIVDGDHTASLPVSLAAFLRSIADDRSR